MIWVPKTSEAFLGFKWRFLFYRCLFFGKKSSWEYGHSQGKFKPHLLRISTPLHLQKMSNHKIDKASFTHYKIYQQKSSKHPKAYNIPYNKQNIHLHYITLQRNKLKASKKKRKLQPEKNENYVGEKEQKRMNSKRSHYPKPLRYEYHIKGAFVEGNCSIKANKNESISEENELNVKNTCWNKYLLKFEFFYFFFLMHVSLVLLDFFCFPLQLTAAVDFPWSFENCLM